MQPWLSTYYEFSFVGPYAPTEFMPKMEAAARKALELDETLADAHFALGVILYRYHWNWGAAEKEYRRGTEFPRGFSRTGYHQFLTLTGRTEEALAEVQRELERDPLPAQRRLNVGMTFGAAGQYDRAIAEFRKVLEKNPRIPRAHFHLGAAHVLKGELNEGIAALEKAVELSPGNQRFVAYLGYAYAAAGRQSDARKILVELRQLAGRQYVSPYGIALIHVGLGEKEAALNWLAKAYEAHAFELAELAADPRLDPLRSDPRFLDLARRVGPPNAATPSATVREAIRPAPRKGAFPPRRPAGQVTK